jgi:hypothetical protein
LDSTALLIEDLWNDRAGMDERTYIIISQYFFKLLALLRTFILELVENPVP